MELVCIDCPRGCKLTIGTNNEVSGNFCKKGVAYAINELTNPTRTVCTTVATAFKNMPVLPVRTKDAIPKAKIFAMMDEVNKVLLTKKVKRGDVILKDIAGTGVALIATATLHED